MSVTVIGSAWRQRAACLDTDPELFYDPHGEPPAAHRRRVAAAKALCARCPVRDICLGEVLAIEGRTTFGIRGGLTARERQALLRARDKGAA